MQPGDPVRLLSTWRWSEVLEPLPEGLCGYVADGEGKPGCVAVDFGAEMGGVLHPPADLVVLDPEEAVYLHARDGLGRRDVLEGQDESGVHVATLLRGPVLTLSLADGWPKTFSKRADPCDPWTRRGSASINEISSLSIPGHPFIAMPEPSHGWGRRFETCGAHFERRGLSLMAESPFFFYRASTSTKACRDVGSPARGSTGCAIGAAS